MTVAEMIEKLEQMPKDLQVINGSCSQEVDVVEYTDNYYTDEGKISCVVVV